jgi:hypothetical protein
MMRTYGCYLPDRVNPVNPVCLFKSAFIRVNPRPRSFWLPSLTLGLLIQNRRETFGFRGGLVLTLKLSLRSRGVLPVQFRSQTVEVGIEGYEIGSALKESLAAGFMRNSHQRALTIVGRQTAAAG